MAYLFLFYLIGAWGSLISTCEIFRDVLMMKGSVSAVCFQAGSPHTPSITKRYLLSEV